MNKLLSSAVLLAGMALATNASAATFTSDHCGTAVVLDPSLGLCDHHRDRAAATPLKSRSRRSTAMALLEA